MQVVMDSPPARTDPAVLGNDVIAGLADIADAAAALRGIATDPRRPLPHDVVTDLQQLALRVHLAVLDIVAPTPRQDRTDDLQRHRRADNG